MSFLLQVSEKSCMLLLVVLLVFNPATATGATRSSTGDCPLSPDSGFKFNGSAAFPPVFVDSVSECCSICVSKLGNLCNGALFDANSYHCLVYSHPGELIAGSSSDTALRIPPTPPSPAPPTPQPPTPVPTPQPTPPGQPWIFFVGCSSFDESCSPLHPSAITYLVAVDACYTVFDLGHLGNIVSYQFKKEENRSSHHTSSSLLSTTSYYNYESDYTLEYNLACSECPKGDMKTAAFPIKCQHPPGGGGRYLKSWVVNLPVVTTLYYQEREEKEEEEELQQETTLRSGGLRRSALNSDNNRLRRSGKSSLPSVSPSGGKVAILQVLDYGFRSIKHCSTFKVRHNYTFPLDKCTSLSQFDDPTFWPFRSSAKSIRLRKYDDSDGIFNSETAASASSSSASPFLVYQTWRKADACLATNRSSSSSSFEAGDESSFPATSSKHLDDHRVIVAPGACYEFEGELKSYAVYRWIF